MLRELVKEVLASAWEGGEHNADPVMQGLGGQWEEFRFI